MSVTTEDCKDQCMELWNCVGFLHTGDWYDAEGELVSTCVT